jgi:hypothetical protein
MKHMYFAALLVWGSAAVSAGQTADALGAHRNYGHGCSACHTLHNRQVQQPGVGSAAVSGEMLWGDGTQIGAAGAAATNSAAAPESKGVLICLSCHDGNYAPPAMMKNQVYEAVPSGYPPLANVPTLIDKPAVTTGIDIDHHPVGESARMKCGQGMSWDCAITGDGLSMDGNRSSRFAMTYGFFVKPRRSGDAAVVECTTCHNPHLMNTLNVSRDSASALYQPGIYSSRYFLRAPYMAGASNTGNQAAQFCRECHADKSNEMNGGPAPTAR